MGIYNGVRRLGVGLVTGGVFLGMGGQETMESLNNKEPLELACSDVQSAPPTREWLKLRGCQIDLTRAMLFYNEKNHKTTDLYIPVFPTNMPDLEKTKLTLHSTKPEWFALVEKFQKVSDAKGDLTAFRKEHEKELVIESEFLGMVETGMSGSSSEHDRIAKGDVDLAEGFSVLRHNKSPSMGMGLGMMALGAVAGLIGIISGIRGFRR